MAKKENGELIFLRYAFPVTGYCSKAAVGAEEILEFEEMLKTGGTPSRQRLEEIFPEAVKHLRGWTPESVRAYWLGEHNKVVRKNPLCAVYLLKVSRVLGPTDGEVCKVNLNGLNTLEVKSYIPLEEGDKVTVHAFQVAERPSQMDIRKYFRQ